MQLISKIGSPENIDLKDTWFTPNIEEDTRKNPRHEPIIARENKKQHQSKLYVQESPENKGEYASALHERLVSEGVRNTPQFKKSGFLNNHPMRPVGYHLTREKRDLQSITKYQKGLR